MVYKQVTEFKLMSAINPQNCRVVISDVRKLSKLRSSTLTSSARNVGEDHEERISDFCFLDIEYNVMKNLWGVHIQHLVRCPLWEI